MSDPPQVSVVIPTRDRPDWLRRTLRSVFAQRGVTLEIIVVDDGSLAQVGVSGDGAGDLRVTVLRNEASVGVAAARNRGLAAAQGQWTAFLDDDDLWSPDKLRLQLAALESGAAFAYAGAIVVDPALRPIGSEPAPPPSGLLTALLRDNVIPGGGSNVVAATSVLRELGGFDETFGFLADWDLWLRLAVTSRPAACVETLVAYTHHVGNWSLREPRELTAEFEALARKHHRLSERQGVEFDRVSFGRYLAVSHRRQGRRLAAMRLYLRTGWGERDIGSLVRGVGALLGEQAIRLAGHRPTAPPRPAWLATYATDCESSAVGPTAVSR